MTLITLIPLITLIHLMTLITLITLLTLLNLITLITIITLLRSLIALITLRSLITLILTLRTRTHLPLPRTRKYPLLSYQARTDIARNATDTYALLHSLYPHLSPAAAADTPESMDALAVAADDIGIAGAI
jgi:hypothetical protein